MQIKLDDLKEILQLILEHHNVDSVELKHDFYWNIPKDSKYDSYPQPSDFTKNRRKALNLFMGSMSH